MLDTEGTKSLDIREVKACFYALGFQQVKKKDIRRLLKENNKEGYHALSFDEVVEIVTPFILDRDPREEVSKVFDLIAGPSTDLSHDGGGITFEKLKKVCVELGENYTDSELKDMVKEADRDGDGKVGKDDFWRVMKKRSGDPLDELDSDDDE